jgi:ketosteroid isomerase-like protein
MSTSEAAQAGTAGDLAHNRQVALRMIEQMSAGIIDDSLVALDVQWWVPGFGVIDRAGFQSLIDGFRALIEGEGRMFVKGITAEGNRVAVEAESDFKLLDGAHYRNTYHFLFEFERGRIRLAKEYNDTKLAAEVLGSLKPG